MYSLLPTDLSANGHDHDGDRLFLDIVDHAERSNSQFPRGEGILFEPLPVPRRLAWLVRQLHLNRVNDNLLVALS
jgi:hypothetical protein